MVYNKEWARDIRFRSKLQNRGIPYQYHKFFLLHLGSGVFDLEHKILKRKMIRYGTSLPVKRCLLTGRSRGLVGDFQVSRHKFKALVEQGFFVGITKSSW